MDKWIKKDLKYRISNEKITCLTEAQSAGVRSGGLLCYRGFILQFF